MSKQAVSHGDIVCKLASNSREKCDKISRNYRYSRYRGYDIDVSKNRCLKRRYRYDTDISISAIYHTILQLAILTHL